MHLQNSNFKHKKETSNSSKTCVRKILRTQIYYEFYVRRKFINHLLLGKRKKT